ncbi:MAG: hypothetical protein JW395_2477 [Nitrospira sp.]|nr:hypothetical protein [Nitrospira sp.]
MGRGHRYLRIWSIGWPGSCRRTPRIDRLCTLGLRGHPLPQCGIKSSHDAACRLLGSRTGNPRTKSTNINRAWPKPRHPSPVGPPGIRPLLWDCRRHLQHRAHHCEGCRTYRGRCPRTPQRSLSCGCGTFWSCCHRHNHRKYRRNATANANVPWCRVIALTPFRDPLVRGRPKRAHSHYAACAFRSY